MIFLQNAVGLRNYMAFLCQFYGQTHELHNRKKERKNETCLKAKSYPVELK
jgi:hypothetical protein